MTKYIEITACKDPNRWYADKVGELVPFVKNTDDGYQSREDAGYINFVQKDEGKIVAECECGFYFDANYPRCPECGDPNF